MIWFVWMKADGPESSEMIDEQDSVSAALCWARRRFERDPSWGSRPMDQDITVRVAVTQSTDDVLDDIRGYFARLSGRQELLIDRKVGRIDVVRLES